MIKINHKENLNFLFLSGMVVGGFFSFAIIIITLAIFSQNSQPMPEKNQVMYYNLENFNANSAHPALDQSLAKSSITPTTPTPAEDPGEYEIYRSIILDDIDKIVKIENDLLQMRRELNQKIYFLDMASVNYYQNKQNAAFADIRTVAQNGKAAAVKEMWQKASNENNLRMKQLLYPYVQKYK